MSKPGPSASLQQLIRPNVRRLRAYVPGEQPKIRGLVKLNTNENPYGPSPKVLAALRAALDGRLRLYPNPTAERLREKLARFHGCGPENIIVGNGSDELLALATRAFVEPMSGLTRYALDCAAKEAIKPERKQRIAALSEGDRGVLVASRYRIQYFQPSYSLYPVLAEIHGAWPHSVPLTSDFSLPRPDQLKASHWDFKAALTFITTPNAPSGRAFDRTALEELCRRQTGVVVLDEAYVDFAKEHSLSWARKLSHVLVARTFSKAYSLCGLRVGYMLGSAELISALDKIRDSYNVNGLGQVGAEATLASLPYYRNNFRRIVRTRERLSRELSELGFDVLPSQTNFILARPPRLPAEAWLKELRTRRVLVRWFSSPDIRDYLRISIGTDTEIEVLLDAVHSVLAAQG